MSSLLMTLDDESGALPPFATPIVAAVRTFTGVAWNMRVR